MDELNQLLAGLPGVDKLSDSVKQQMLEQSLVPDTEGRDPYTEGYTKTYDTAYAAWLLVGVLSAFPMVTSAGSEGTSVSMTRPDWEALKRSFAVLSPIMARQDTLRVLRLPPDPYVRHRNMLGRYDDVNTSI